MKPRFFRSFLGRCTVLAVTFVIISILLSSSVCFMALNERIDAQEDKAMRINLGRSAQSFEDLLNKADTCVKLAAARPSFSTLLNVRFDKDYERVAAVHSYSVDIQEYVTRLPGVDWFYTFFPDNVAAVHGNQGNASAQQSSLPWSFASLLERFPSQEMEYILEIISLDGQNKPVVLRKYISAVTPDRPVFFAMILGQEYWSTLTKDAFSLRLTCNDVYYQYNLSPADQSYLTAECSVALDREGWSMQAFYSHSGLQWRRRDLLLPLFLLGAAFFTVLIVRLTLRQHVAKLHALEEVIQQRLSSGNGTLPSQSKSVRGLPLKIKMALMMTGIVMVSILGSAVLVFYNHSEETGRQIHRVFEQTAESTADYIDQSLQGFKGALETVALSYQAQELLVSGSSDDGLLWDLQQSFGFVPPVYGNIAAFSLQGQVLGSSIYRPNYFQEYGLENLPISEERVSRRQYWTYTPGIKDPIEYCMLIVGSHRTLPGYGEKVGFIQMNCSDDRLKTILRQFAEEQYFMGIYDSEGSLLMSTDSYPEDPLELSAEIVMRQIPTTNWTLSMIIPKRVIAEQQNQIFLFGFFVMGAVLLVLIALSLLLVRRMLSAVNQLNHQIALRERDQTTEYVPDSKHPDEIYQLGLQFNHMLQTLDEANRQKLETERKSREFEVNMLQAQINPHFLYNTLRTLQVLILRQDSRAISVIDRLITFFRSSAHLQVGQIPLKEELEQVRAYVEIQTVRFGSRFAVEYDLPEQYMNHRVVRFCLQPIVENAISHGMADIQSGGLIRISAAEEKGRFLLRVSDNGCGISDENLSKLRQKLENAEYDSHIGVLNVHQRIQLVFGKDYGAHIEQNHPRGTIVELRFPIISE